MSALSAPILPTADRPIADFEKVIRSSAVTAGFNGGITAPQYFTVSDYVPDLQSRLLTGPGAGGPEPVVAISVQAFLQIIDTANVQYAGIVAARIGYVNVPGGGSAILTTSGASFPSTGWTQLLAAEAYDPMSLPLGGVDYPVWTRAASDPLAANIRLDRAGPGYPWVSVDFWVYSAAGDADAVQVTVQQRMLAAS